MAAHALAIFSGAFLLFLVQPLIGKYILPWFGGTPGVWTVCMLFFQLLLLVGYAYAHLSVRFLATRTQALVHIGVLAFAVLTLPIAPAEAWKPEPGQDPTLWILLLLGASIGPAYFALSTTGPLLQSWSSVLSGGASPYRLYALSNVGSMLALLSYPFVIEPMLSRRAQAVLWSVGMGVFAAICGYCAILLFRRAATAAGGLEPEDREGSPRPSLREHAVWMLLPSIASVMLLATTHRLSNELAAIPFLWVLPLSIYLLSFVLCFDNPRWYQRRFFAVALLVCMVSYDTISEGDSPIVYSVLAHSVFLFVVCMLCHGELYRLRPAPRYLTAFYLAVAAGGALGGVLVALVAPLVFVYFEEFELAILACGLLVLALHYFDEGTPGRGPGLAWLLLAVSFVGLGANMIQSKLEQRQVFSYAARDFHGGLYIDHPDVIEPSSLVKVLWSGNTRHGLQVSTPALRRRPTSYFGEESGIGLALRTLGKRRNLRVGVVGLGIGTIAAYGRPGDQLRFYEINPRVAQVAADRFTYLSDTSAQVSIILGDARLSLESEAPQEFDLLALDAFTSDAPPVHLLTRQAFEIYLRQLKPDGVIAVNISNRHLDLKPVLAGIAEHFSLTALHVLNEPKQGRWWMLASEWILLTRDPVFPESSPIADGASRLDSESGAGLVWTDERTSLLDVLN